VKIALTVNGAPVSADVEPRTHLADFLREHLLLTGTHLGCEHGVCGACTVLIDGAPARSCIAFAADCAGRDVRAIEGLTDDPVVARLRAAFTAEHALQCGYCTPGMLVTARDIVLRLPRAEEATVRLELAGNLCRCTGYAGIVRAILRVLREGAPAAEPEPRRVETPSTPAAPLPAAAPTSARQPTGPQFTEKLTLALPPDAVWRALRDPALIASCVPGATLTEADEGRIAGTLDAALGPIRARFSGQGRVSYDDPARAGRVEGEGADTATGTRLRAAARFAVTPSGDAGTLLTLDVEYGLRGALAQFARGPLVRAFAAEIARDTAARLEARLRGDAPPPAARPLSAAGLLWRTLRAWFARLGTRARDGG
jgi:carbon-monoxide dehydrogenase small subunit